MSRSRRKKKHKRGVRVSRASAYNPDEQPESIDSPQSFPQGRALASSSADGSSGVKEPWQPSPNTPNSEPELCSQVRVYSLHKPPRYLHLISEWLARDAIERGEATLIRESNRIRGIQYVTKTAPDPVAPEKAGSLRSGGVGDSHDHDTPLNPAKVWTIDPFPQEGRHPERLERFIRRTFTAVLDSCIEPDRFHPCVKAA